MTRIGKDSEPFVPDLSGLFSLAITHPRKSIPDHLRMICGSSAQIGVEERLAARCFAAVVRFDGNEYGVHLRQHIRIIGLEHPATVRLAVQIEDSQADGLRVILPSRSPNLEGLRSRCLGIAIRWLLIEVERVKDQRLALRIEYAAKRLALTAVLVDVRNIGNVELARSHELPHIPVRSKKLFIPFGSFVPIPELRC